MPRRASNQYISFKSVVEDGTATHNTCHNFFLMAEITIKPVSLLVEIRAKLLFYLVLLLSIDYSWYYC